MYSIWGLAWSEGSVNHINIWVVQQFSLDQLLVDANTFTRDEQESKAAAMAYSNQHHNCSFPVPRPSPVCQ